MRVLFDRNAAGANITGQRTVKDARKEDSVVCSDFDGGKKGEGI